MQVQDLIAGIVLSLLLAGGGCQEYSAPAAPESSPAPVPTAVGPIPGAGSNVKFRSNPFANDPVALQEGRKLFNWYNCSGCHGGHAGGGMGPSLRDQVWLFGERDDQIFDSIAAGRGHGMPSWGSKIPEDQIWKLVTYIKSMRTAQEPEPPRMPEHEEVAQPAITHPGHSAQKD
ncbi:MAG TPA: c-type cytochrome [Candidatus Sulfotelmatobacter sp.]|jgi:cytochrome c oxidase cbb3-type subunit 3|nr:c-type cytochrome [Candidatus Sulfotelmatobacter sp.]